VTTASEAVHEAATPVDTTGDPAEFIAKAALVSTSPQEATANETTPFVAVQEDVTPVGSTGGRAGPGENAVEEHTSKPQAPAPRTHSALRALVDHTLQGPHA
jgi:hypothetical protein